MTAGVTQYTEFDPSGLFAGGDDVRHRSVVYAAGSGVILRGTVLGRVTGGGAATQAAKAGNTGNATIAMDGSAPVGATAEAGVYKVIWTSATAYKVLDPNGDQIGTGTNTGTFNNQIKFVATAGLTPMVAGDEIDITISVQDKYVASIASATDGSQTPSAIAACDVDVSGGAVMGPAYFEGTFAAEKLIFDTTMTAAGAEALFRQSNSNIYIRSLGTLG